MISKKKLQKSELWTKAFCSVAILSQLTYMAFVIEPLITEGVNKKTIYFFAIGVTFFIFQLSHTAIGVFTGNPYELIAAMITQILITVLVCLQFFTDLLVDLYSEIVFAGTLFWQLWFIVLAYPMWKERNWRFYRVFGTDPEKRRIVKSYFKFTVGLRLDLLLVTLTIILSGNMEEWVLDTVCFILTSLVAIIGYFGAKEERFPLMCIFWTSSIISPIYIAYGYYKLSIMLIGISFVQITHIPLMILFGVFGLLSCISKVLLIIQSLLVYNNFGKGTSSLTSLASAGNDKGKSSSQYMSSNSSLWGNTILPDLDEDGLEDTEDEKVDDMLKSSYNILTSASFSSVLPTPLPIN